MNKKVSKTLGLVLLLILLLPSSLVNAETVDNVPMGETTLSTVADDPLKEYKEKAATQVSTIEEPESGQKKETETQSSEDTPTTESSSVDTPENGTKAKPQPRGGGIGPQTMNLIEGVDIDAGLALFLRTAFQSPVIFPGNVNVGFTGTGKAKDTLTDDDMKTLTDMSVNNGYSWMSTKGLEHATNLEVFKISDYNFSEMDFSHNPKLVTIDSQRGYSLVDVDVSKCIELKYLTLTNSQLSDLDVTKNPKLIALYCYSNSINNLDLSMNTELSVLDCSNNQLLSLDTTDMVNLNDLRCTYNSISNLDISKNPKLSILHCSGNPLGNIDTTKNPELSTLIAVYNQISSLDLSQNSKLTSLDCSRNQLDTLDISGNSELVTLLCQDNNIDSMDVSQNAELKQLECYNNEIIDLNVSNTKLERLRIDSNHISDISSANGLTNLTYLKADNQSIFIPVPSVIGSQATVDILKTAGSVGLSADVSSIIPTPMIVINGDKIELGNVTREALDNKTISFDYDGSQLIEGASTGNKSFAGDITFFSVSDLSNKMMPNIKKVKSGEDIVWMWSISSLTPKKAENIYAAVNLPAGLVIDPSSITKNGTPSTLADIDGTNNLGNLNKGEGIIFTFTTTVNGSVDEWLEAEIRVDWEDDAITSPYNNESKGRVQIQDDEQAYTPKDTDDMSIQSVPIYFNHGTNPIMNTAQTHHLHSMNYQSNTNVVTDGFYTRIKDDRSISTGWKLTAKLSDFKDSSNSPMPNGTGTSLKLENLSIERVTDRDTPQETIDPAPTGADVPSSIQTTETLVAGQPTAKSLVSAQPNEGQDTWQLRMPFDKISLNLPANAGKKGTVYKAKLTWSLDDTP